MVDAHPGAVVAERIEALVDELATRLAGAPEEAFTRRRAAEEWTAAEVVGHLTEMFPYWARAAARIAAQPGSSFGRELDDPDRVGAVATANTVPRAAALAHLRHAAHESATMISALDAQGWDARGMHATRGEMPVHMLIMSLVVEHAEGHARQALAASGVDG